MKKPTRQQFFDTALKVWLICFLLSPFALALVPLFVGQEKADGFAAGFFQGMDQALNCRETTFYGKVCLIPKE